MGMDSTVRCAACEGSIASGDHILCAHCSISCIGGSFIGFLLSPPANNLRIRICSSACTMVRVKCMPAACCLLFLVLLLLLILVVIVELLLLAFFRAAVAVHCLQSMARHKTLILVVLHIRLKPGVVGLWLCCIQIPDKRVACCLVALRFHGAVSMKSYESQSTDHVHYVVFSTPTY